MTKPKQCSLTYGSLFAGLGGFDLGFIRAGYTCEWQVEIDEYCQYVLKKNFPGVNLYADIRTCKDLPAVDVIVGGFPCQPHSVAGARLGSKDERDLWPEFIRVIRETRPRWVVAENVRGILSSEDGRYFGGILRSLAVSGYDAEWAVLPTGIRYGHRRDRLFVVAYTYGERLQSAGEHREAEIETPRIFVESTFTSVFRAQPAPAVVRNVHGIPKRAQRIQALGNSVIPDVAQWIAERILEYDRRGKN